MQQGETSTISARNQSATPPPTPLINLPSLADDDTNVNLPSIRRGGGGRRWIIIVVVVLLIILLAGLIFRALNRGPRVTYQYGQVTQGNLTLTVNATGPIQSGTYNLVFNGSGGKIDEIDVTVGEKVTKGQVLARLDKTALQDAVDQAQTAVNNAQASLNAALNAAGSTSNQSGASVSAAQTAVADAENSQTQTKATGDASVASAQTALDNAQTNLTQVTNTANAQKQAALTTYQTAAAQASPACPSDPTSISDSSSLSPACQQALATYNNTVAQANQSVATAQAQVNTAQSQLNQAQATANANNTTAQNQVDSAKSQLKSAQAGAGVSGTTGQSQVVSAQSQLNTALAQLNQAKHNLANATLTAPHAGTVTIINGTVGGTPGVSANGTTAGSTTAGNAFIQIVDLTALQVQANVNEADIANLADGETASFTVNAYGDQQFNGTISAIPPIGQTVSNVVTYPVTIDVDPNSLKGAHLLPSMTANVTINAVQHNGVLLLPVNAINFARLASSGTNSSGAIATPQLITPQQANNALNQARGMLSNLEVANPNLVSEGPTPAFVIEKSGTQFVAKPVVLGLTDGTSYEVLQGLSLNDTFIVGTNG